MDILNIDTCIEKVVRVALRKRRLKADMGMLIYGLYCPEKLGNSFFPI